MSYSAVLGASFKTTTVGVVDSSRLSIWLDELTAMCPGATINVLRLAVRTAFREFCTRTGAWNREIGPISLEAGQDGYEIPPQDDASILYILNMFYGADGENREAIHPVQAPFQHTIMKAPATKPIAFVGELETPGTFRLVPVPDQDVLDVINVFVALGPKDPHIDDIPSFFVSHHYDALLDGAVAKLYMQPNKPYTNLVLGQYYTRKFNKAVAVARDVAKRQFTSAPHAWAYPRWA